MKKFLYSLALLFMISPFGSVKAACVGPDCCTITAGVVAGLTGIVAILKGLVEGTWKWFKGLFSFLTSLLPIGTDTVLTILQGLVDGTWKWFKGLFNILC